MNKFTLIITAALLTGCAGRGEFIPPSPGDEEYAPPELDYSQPATRNGSLFVPTMGVSLFTDTKAYQVGDILTVNLDEKTKSDKKADTQFGKTSSAQIDVPTFGNTTFPDYSASISGDRDFSGNSSSAQANQLQGNITVTVFQVLPNGVLRIRGEKWLTLNQGDEFIRLVGNVRVEDIDSDNVISSQRIADARITYAGRGALADSNSAGWLTQFFTSPWIPW